MDELFLRFAYSLNVFILIPVLYFMFSDVEGRPLRAFQSTVANSDGLRLLVASLWSSILILSLFGLLLPRFCLPVLILQVLYKAIYCASYLGPRAKLLGTAKIPIGLAVSFIFIVLVYPWIIAYSICSVAR